MLRMSCSDAVVGRRGASVVVPLYLLGFGDSAECAPGFWAI